MKLVPPSVDKFRADLNFCIWTASTQTKQMLLNMAKEDGDDDEETNQWSRMQKLLKRGVIDVGLETSKEAKPVYPTVLLLTGPFL